MRLSRHSVPIGAGDIGSAIKLMLCEKVLTV